MTADEDALLATIAANPADDLPRLVYADWLEEHGQSVRAEFIRVQIEIAKLEVGPRAVIDRNVPLWKRQQELLDGHLGELMPAAATGFPWGAASRPAFHRGFLTAVHVGAAEFYAQAPRLAALRPRPAVHLHAAYQAFDGWGADPDHALVTDLDLADDGDSVPPPALVDPATLAGWWREFTSLRTLTLAGVGLGDDGLRAIPWADLPALVDLDISNNNITDAGVVALINTGLPQRLERLILGGNPIGDPSAYELADRVGRSRTLKHLNLRYTDITNVGQSAIMDRFGGRVDLF